MTPEPVDFCIAQDMVALRANDSKVYPRYLFAALRSSSVQNQIEQLHVGTLIPHFKKGDFDKLWLDIPAREIQEFIGDMYFEFSAKIDLNQRMNDTLEMLGRAYFHRVQSAAQEVARLDTLVDLVVDRISPERKPRDLPYIALDDMPSGSISLHSWRLSSQVNSSMIRFAHRDVLFGNMRPYFHKVGRAPFEGLCRTTTFVLRPGSRVATYMVFALSERHAIDFATAASVGTTIPYIKWDALSQYPIPIPTGSELENFEKLVGPFLDLIDENNSETKVLAEIRDTALPNLLSGKLRAKGTEEVVAT